jgi:uncharacterized RDD family membrane protein YckC
MTYGYAAPGTHVTGEAVALELPPARVGSRTVAFCIDFTIEMVLYFGLSIAYVVIGLNLDSDLSATFGLLLLIAILFGYPILMTTLMRGRTPGKAVMGLRVLRDDGGPAAFTAIMIRESVGVFLEKPGITLGLLAVFTSMGSERAKRVGDMTGGTIVVIERVPGQQIAPVQMPPPLAYWAATVDLSRMPDSLGLAIRQFLSRAGQLDPAARERVGGQLASQVAALTSPPPPPGTPGWAYLSAILAERRRREEMRSVRPTGPRVAMPYAPHVPDPPVGPYTAPVPAPPPPPGPGGFSVPS